MWDISLQQLQTRPKKECHLKILLEVFHIQALIVPEEILVQPTSLWINLNIYTSPSQKAGL